MKAKSTEKLAFAEFAPKVIERLKADKKPSPKTGKIGKGIFAQSFNEVARQYYGATFDVRKAVDTLLADGVIEGHPVKGGFMLYLQGEGPSSQKSKPEDVLKDLGLNW